MARKTKTPTPVSPLDAVAGLIEERAKFEQWLDDLEAKRDATPPKVYDRVHQDYLTRLQGVMEQLKSHTEALQTHATNLNKKLVELSSAEESRLEERAEAELRAKVGEMTPAEWDVVSKKADKELAKLKEDQELIETDLDRIQGILEELAGGAPAGKKEPKVDELEFLKSVVGTGPRPAAVPPAPRPSSPAQPARTSGSGTSAATPAAGTPAAPAAADAPPPGKAATPAAGASAAPPSSPVPPAAKTTPTTGSIEVPKTLKCQECGTMNYPSEWYCEKCGAEMTVV